MPPEQPSGPCIAPPVLEAALDAWAEAGRCSRVPVQGNSMWPLLQPGDLALVVHGSQGLHRGDVVAYRCGEQVVIHRLLRRQGTGALLLGGDSRFEADPPVPVSALVGRVVAVDGPDHHFSLQSPSARALGWALALSFPLRRRRRLRRAVAWLPSLAAWVLRR